MIGLKPISVQDASWLHSVIIRNIDRLVNYFPVTVRQVSSLVTAQNTIADYEHQWQQNKFRVYVIKQQLTSVGLLFIKHIDTNHSKCELAYFIDKDFEGQGIVTEAIKKSQQIAFEELGLNKVFCKVDIANLASCKAAEKAGLVQEGILRQEYKMSDGSFVDVVYYGIVKEGT